MTTFATIKATVADQLSRTDLDDQIEKAVLRAINRHAQRGTYFNQEEATLSTASGDNAYGLPSDFLSLESLRITYNDSDWTLDPRPISHLYDLSDIQGQPTVYAIHQEQLRLYPTPDQTYTLTLAYLKILTALSGPTDTNAWTDDVEELIAAAACETLCRGIIRDFPWADQWRLQRMDAEKALNRRTALATTTRTLHPSGLC